jgi:hypothetical protein
LTTKALCAEDEAAAISSDGHKSAMVGANGRLQMLGTTFSDSSINKPLLATDKVFTEWSLYSPSDRSIHRVVPLFTEWWFCSPIGRSIHQSIAPFTKRSLYSPSSR